jgi:hypothetical protein
MLFNGTSDYISVANDARLNPSQALTVTAWFKVDTFGAWPPIVKKTGPSPSQRDGYTLEINYSYGSRGLLFGVDLGTSVLQNVFIPTPALQAGTWYFAAGTYDGTNSSLYFGTGGLPLEWNTIAGSGVISQSSGELNIGRDPSNPTSRHFDGAIDEVRIYDRALSSTEVNELYSSVPEPSSIAIWSILGGLGMGVAWRRRARRACQES